MEIFVFALIGLGLYLMARRRGATAPELGPVGWVPGIRFAPALPLARAELRRLLLHPAFIAGLALTALVVFGTLGRGAIEPEWPRISTGVALRLVPLGWLTIAAAHLLTTRPTRTGTDALFASLPAPQPTRTAALLATMIGPVGVATVLAAAMVALLSRADFVEPTGSPNVAEIAAGILIVAGAVAVGVGVGRFLPHPLFGVAAIVAVTVIQARFLDPTTWPWDEEEAHPLRFLGFLGSDTSADPVLEYRPTAWHLVYLAALVVFMALVALARSGVPRHLAVALAASVGLAGVAGWMQTRPAPPARVAEMVRYLEHPEAHQTCEERGRARYCVFPDGARNVAGWDKRVNALFALAPAAATAGRHLQVRERVPTVVGNSNCSPVAFSAGLVKEVAAAIDPARVWRADDAIHPGTDTLPCSDESVNGFFFAVQVGTWTVGLPSSPHGLDERCRADGRSRAALALWLGAASTPGGVRQLRALVNEQSGDHIRFDSWNDPPMWGVEFARADAKLALILLQRPKADTAATFGAHWARVSAPTTTSAELADLFGLHPASAPATGATTCA
ncbi:MAG TPA: hypothetical protein VMZ22_06435 [Acidimicrobiales bacterium]|nr:hypothetical protein [Acidimicrobiales bacterium]